MVFQSNLLPVERGGVRELHVVREECWDMVPLQDGILVLEVVHILVLVEVHILVLVEAHRLALVGARRLVLEVVHTLVPNAARNLVPNAAGNLVPDAAGNLVPDAAHILVPDAARNQVPDAAHTQVPDTAHTLVPEMVSATEPPVDGTVAHPHCRRQVDPSREGLLEGHNPLDDTPRHECPEEGEPKGILMRSVPNVPVAVRQEPELPTFPSSIHTDHQS